MTTPRPVRLAVAAVAILTVGAALTASAGANTVPASKAGSQTIPRTIAQVTPTECSSLSLTALVVGSGSFNGTNAAELILGSAGNDTINGRGASDCVVGGAGNDRLTGGAGNDILLGGPGNDIMNGSAGTNICYGGGGGDTSSNCTFFP